MTNSRFWSAYWVLLRPYLLFVSGVSGAAGLALARDLPAARFAAAFPAFFFAYGLGQALTDVFQTDTDAISAPYRPLVRGIVSPRQVLAVSLSGLAVCGAILAALNPWNLALSAAAIVGLLTYTPAKRHWWAGPFWNAWIVALLPVMGALCGRQPAAPRLLVPLTASVFFSYAIFVLLGYFKDISADRATGYRTLPVTAGWRPSIAASAALWVTAVAAGVAYFAALGRPSAIGLALWLAGAGAMALAHVQMWRTSGEKEAHHSIASTVRGYMLLHLGEIVGVCPAVWPAALAVYAAFEWALAARPERSQV